MNINESTKILITGCGGMLGDAFFNYYKSRVNLMATDIDLNESWLKYMDVRDFSKYRKCAIDFKPDIIIHLAAFTDLEYCEKNIEETYRTNTLAVENAVCVAKEINATLVYISTAGIFDGQKKCYDDWDLPNPLNVYGRSKYYGEVFVEKNMEKYFIVRAGWMMGGGEKKDKKFVNKIMKQIISGKTELSVVNDKLGTPTYTFDFAKNVFELIKTEFYGVYNMVCGGNCSRYDVAVEIVNILNRRDRIKIKIVDSEYFAYEYFAPRPYSEELVNKKLGLRELNIMQNWKVSLRDYIMNYYKHLVV
jgi:dTDP-4-dehydrorhamnose reductase